MVERERLEKINEIRDIERALYDKRSRLASSEAMEYGVTLMLPYLQGEGLNSDKWGDVFTKLIGKIGDASSGGNSVEDVRLERQR